MARKALYGGFGATIASVRTNVDVVAMSGPTITAAEDRELKVRTRVAKLRQRAATLELRSSRLERKAASMKLKARTLEEQARELEAGLGSPVVPASPKKR